MINREAILDFFKDIEEFNDFNLDEKLLWSYFFLDKSRENLQEFSIKLEQLGYEFDSIFEAEKINEEDDIEYYPRSPKSS